MIYRIVLMVIAMALSFLSCTTQKNAQLEWEVINNADLQQIQLTTIEDNKLIADISVQMQAGFDLPSDFEKATVLKIQTNDRKISEMLFFYEPHFAYTLKINGKDGSIQGPKNSLQEEYNTLFKELTPLNEKLTKVSQDTTMTFMQLDTLSTNYFKDILKVKKRHIEDHPKSLVSLFLLKEMVAMEVLSFHELQSLFDIVNSDNHNQTALLGFIEDKLKAIIANRIVGDPAPQFTLNNPDDIQFTPESFKGNYTLIDFWASWCAPCRVANKKISLLYNKYNPKGFNIVSISFDDDRQKWLKAIKEDKITWEQLSDLKGFDKSPIKDLYKIKSMPTTYLISPEGKVIDQNLTHQELEQLLEKIYK